VVSRAFAVLLLARVFVARFADDRLARDAFGANVLDIVVVSLGITALLIIAALRAGYLAARNAIRPLTGRRWYGNSRGFDVV
jgi:hypothetical protein